MTTGILRSSVVSRTVLSTSSPSTFVDEEALRRTLTTGKATYWSRSRQEYWVKGETSGNHQAVVDVALDCDGDTILVTVRQTGAACHTGNRTCFFTPLTAEDAQ